MKRQKVNVLQNEYSATQTKACVHASRQTTCQSEICRHGSLDMGTHPPLPQYTQICWPGTVCLSEFGPRVSVSSIIVGCVFDIGSEGCGASWYAREVFRWAIDLTLTSRDGRSGSHPYVSVGSGSYIEPASAAATRV